MLTVLKTQVLFSDELVCYINFTVDLVCQIHLCGMACVNNGIHCPMDIGMDSLMCWLTDLYISCLVPSPLTDCSDSAGGGRGLLLFLATPSCGLLVGGVWEFSTQPGVVRVPGDRPLPSIQQLIGQSHHLRIPVGKLPQGVQTGVQVQAHQRLSPQ